MFLQNLVEIILNQGIIIAQKSQNSLLYPYLLGSIVLSIMLGVVNVITTFIRVRSSLGTILYVELRFLALHELVPIYCLWLAFATPYDSYFFGTAGAAVLLHGALAIYGAFDLSTSWVIQLYFARWNAAVSLSIVVGLALIAFGWEVQQWPLLFVLIGELILSFFVASLTAGMVFGSERLQRAQQRLRSLQGYPPATIITLARGEVRTIQLFSALFFLLLLAGLVWIVLWHPIDIYAVTLIALFFVAAQLDSVYVLVRGSASFSRAFVLFPLMLIVTTILAGGVLDSITHNNSVTYAFWIEVGTAAAAFLLFRPLVVLARMAAVRSILEEGKRAAVALIQPQVSALLPPGAPVVDATSGGPDTSQDKVVDDQQDDDVGARLAQQVWNQSRYQAAVMFKALNPWMWVSLLGIVLLYHNVSGTSDLLARLGDNFTTVFLAAVSAFLAVLALFVGKTFEASRDVLLALAVVIVLTAVGDVILNSNVDANGALLRMPGTLEAILNDRHYLLVTAHSILQEFLVLLALGQAYFLGIVLYARFVEHEQKNSAPV